MEGGLLTFSSFQLTQVYLRQAVREMRAGISVFQRANYWDPASQQQETNDDCSERDLQELILKRAHQHIRQLINVRRIENGASAFLVKGRGMLKRLTRPLLQGFARFDRKQWIQRYGIESDNGFFKNRQMCQSVAKAAKNELDRLHESAVHCSLYYPHILISEALEVKFVGYSHWRPINSRFFVFDAAQRFDVGSFSAADTVKDALEIDNYWLFCFLWGFFTGRQITVDSRLEDVLPGCCDVKWMEEIARRNFPGWTSSSDAAGARRAEEEREMPKARVLF